MLHSKRHINIFFFSDFVGMDLPQVLIPTSITLLSRLRVIKNILGEDFKLPLDLLPVKFTFSLRRVVNRNKRELRRKLVTGSLKVTLSWL